MEDKNCPFCGEKPEFSCFVDVDRDVVCFYGCKNCHAGFREYNVSEEKLKEKWNKRK